MTINDCLNLFKSNTGFIMRCKKCGFISFDWVESCGKCGGPLEQERELLGKFIPSNGNVNWFKEVDAGPGAVESQAAETGVHADISDIDVSDLLPDSQVSQQVEIEETELKRAAEDEQFQRALEEITQ